MSSEEYADKYVETLNTMTERGYVYIKVGTEMGINISNKGDEVRVLDEDSTKILVAKDYINKFKDEHFSKSEEKRD